MDVVILFDCILFDDEGNVSAWTPPIQLTNCRADRAECDWQLVGTGVTDQSSTN